MKIDVVQLELRKSHAMDLPLETNTVYNARQASKIFCTTIGGLNVEHVALLCLDSANRVVNYSNISIGEINNVKVSLAQLFRTALLSNASKLMIAHNHPTGILEITSKDIEMTRKIAFFANAFSMELLDSVVVTSEDFISIRAHWKEFLNDREDSIQN